MRCEDALQLFATAAEWCGQAWYPSEVALRRYGPA
jgi:hypothetical protein